MSQNPIADRINQPVTTSLEYNLKELRGKLRAPLNADVVTRRFMVSDFSCALLFFDGMIDAEMINKFVLEPILQASPFQGDPGSRIEWLSNTMTTSSLRGIEDMDDIVDAVLMGETALLVDGCNVALVVDMKGFSRRNVEQPVNETGIIGPHEAFVESMKINMTMLRRTIRSPRLVSEQVDVGNGITRSCAIVYLDGVMNEQILTELRRRLENINLDFVLSAGELEQLIEDSPFSLLPQVIQTERPDRAASFIISGMAVVMIEGSPMVLGIPATFMHLLQTPDLFNMRLPYGIFKRAIIVIGLFFTTLLPAVYLSIAQFHNDLLPIAIMTSIYETESKIPTPLVYEIIILSLGFDMILEAGSRMPGVLANGLGTVSALIIGQAMVAAELVSPLIIVVVAVAGLGSLILPEYNMSVAVRLIQFMLLLVAAVGGLFGVLLAAFLLLVSLSCQTSLGVPLLWSFTPGRMHNPDNLTRYPVWQQRIRHYLVNPSQLFRARGRMRAWDQEDKSE